MTKEEQYFIDWESRTFGFGYGSGERYVFEALKTFFGCLRESEHGSWGYSYEDIEEKLGATVTWLLINALCNRNVIDYGTSTRYAWLSRRGMAVKNFVDGRTVDELYNLVMDKEMDDLLCQCNGTCEGHDDCRSNPMVHGR
jgi:hypothetical protein